MKIYKEEIILIVSGIAVIGGLFLGGFSVQKAKQNIASINEPPETNIGVGDEMYLQAQATTQKGKVSYIWYKDGEALPEEYQGEPSIRIDAFSKDDAGVYTVAPVVTEGKLQIVCAQSEPVTLQAHVHTGGTATCTEKAVCEVCDKTYGEVKEHHGGEATCISKAVCVKCGKEYGDFDYKNHVEDAGTEETGRVSASCTKDGYTGDTICSACHKVLKKGEAIPATGHSFETEVTDLKCSICGEKNPEFKNPTYPKDAAPNPTVGSNYAKLVYPNLGISTNIVWGDDDLMLGTANTVCQFIGSSVLGSEGSHMLHTNGGALAKLGSAKNNDDIVIQVGNYLYAYKVDSISTGLPTADVAVILDAAGNNLVSTSGVTDEIYLYAPTDASGIVTVVHAKISTGAVIGTDTAESAKADKTDKKDTSTTTSNTASGTTNSTAVPAPSATDGAGT